jgi:hypothetical protein
MACRKYLAYQFLSQTLAAHEEHLPTPSPMPARLRTIPFHALRRCSHSQVRENHELGTLYIRIGVSAKSFIVVTRAAGRETR